MSTKNKKTDIIKIRVTSVQKARAIARARKYFKGDLSERVRHCLENSIPPKK